MFTKLDNLHPTHACREYNEAFRVLKEKCHYNADNIPQLQDVSEFLRGKINCLLFVEINLFEIAANEIITEREKQLSRSGLSLKTNLNLSLHSFVFRRSPF